MLASCLPLVALVCLFSEKVVQRKLVDEAEALALKDSFTIQQLREKLRFQAQQIETLRFQAANQNAGRPLPQIVPNQVRVPSKHSRKGRWISLSSRELEGNLGCR